MGGPQKINKVIVRYV